MTDWEKYISDLENFQKECQENLNSYQDRVSNESFNLVSRLYEAPNLFKVALDVDTAGFVLRKSREGTSPEDILSILEVSLMEAEIQNKQADANSMLGQFLKEEYRRLAAFVTQLEVVVESLP